MVKWLRPASALSLLLTLSGCSLFGGEEDLVVMAPVPEFTSQFEVETQWKVQVGDGVEDYFSQLEPVAAYEGIFAADRFGLVYGLGLDGKKRWSVDLSKVESNNRFSGNTSNARISGGLTAAYQNIYLGTENADVFALDAATGKIRWQQSVPGEVIAKPAADDGVLVVMTSNGHLVALDAFDGTQKWSVEVPMPSLTLRSVATPVINQGAVFLGRDDGRLGIYALGNGKQLVDKKLISAKGSTEIDRLIDIDSTPLLIGSQVFTLGYNGSMAALDLASGQDKWQRAYSGYQDITLAGGSLFVTDSRSHLYAVGRYDGSEQWSQTALEYRGVTSVAVDGQYLLVGDSEGYLYWLDRDTGALVSKQLLDSDGLYVKPLVLEDKIIIQTRSGRLIALKRA
jgi:outer membrane protein assembly factor BamB